MREGRRRGRGEGHRRLQEAARRRRREVCGDIQEPWPMREGSEGERRL